MLVACIVISCALAAQPEPGALEAASRMQAAYAGGPFAERAALIFSGEPGEASSFEFVLRQGESEGVAHAALELPALRLHYASGVLTAERAGEPNPAVVFRVDHAGEDFLGAIAPYVPPMPMPQLWRFDERGRCADPALGALEITGYTPEPPTLVLRSQAGEVFLSLGAGTGRALSLEAPLRGGAVRAAYEPIEPGEPAGWRIPTSGRWRVSRLAQLVPPAEPLVPGVQLADLNMVAPGFRGVLLSELQEDKRVREAGPWVVLFVCRGDADRETFALAGDMASELWHAAAVEIASLPETDHARYWLGHRSVVLAVWGELEILPEQMREIESKAPMGVPVFVSTAPARTLDRLAAPAPLTAVLIDPERTVGAVVPIENAETGVSAVMDAMRSFARRPVSPEAGG